MDDSIVEKIKESAFDVYKYDVYRNFYREEDVIIPKDGKGIVFQDVQHACGSHISISMIENKFKEFYLFGRGPLHSYDDLLADELSVISVDGRSFGKYLQINHNIHLIGKYVCEKDLFITMRKGTVIQYNGELFPLGEDHMFINRSRIPSGINAIIYHIEKQMHNSLLCEFTDERMSKDNPLRFGMIYPKWMIVFGIFPLSLKPQRPQTFYAYSIYFQSVYLCADCVLPKQSYKFNINRHKIHAVSIDTHGREILDYPYTQFHNSLFPSSQSLSFVDTGISTCDDS